MKTSNKEKLVRLYPPISAFTYEQCKKLAGLSLIQMYLTILHENEWSITDNKNCVLENINDALNTNYNINHLNNWIAKRKPIPKKAESFIRAFILGYLFGDDVADMLAGLY